MRYESGFKPETALEIIVLFVLFLKELSVIALNCCRKISGSGNAAEQLLQLRDQGVVKVGVAQSI